MFFELPFSDLLYAAQWVHRQVFDPNAVQVSTLVSIKTGACPEDCAYCPQSSRYNTGLKVEKLMSVKALKQAALQAREAGATRFCMGAAYRGPTDKQVEKIGEMIREVRICKSELEQNALRGAHRRGERAFLEMKSIIRGGASEIELQRELAEKLAPEGISITPMVQSGPNGAIPHNPTGDRKLQEGDTVVMDSVTPFDGYFNDITRTYAIGEPSDRAKKAYRTVRRAQQAAIDAAKPGVECQQLDKIARGIITDAGFGEFFTHRLGHGLGIEVHEPPFLVGGNTEKLRAGMCVTMEPGIYVPGEFGIRIEDDVLITETGCEVISGELTTDVTDAFG